MSAIFTQHFSHSLGTVQATLADSAARLVARKDALYKRIESLPAGMPGDEPDPTPPTALDAVDTRSGS